MEKIILSRGNYNRIDKGVNLALELENRATSTRAISPPQQAISQRLAKLTGETTTTNDGLTWKAEEVYLDATGAVVTKPNGYEWTDDNPVFTLNAGTQDAVLLVSQSGRPAVNPDPAKRYWFGNPGGGGGATGTVLKVTDVLSINVYRCSVINNSNDQVEISTNRTLYLPNNTRAVLGVNAIVPAILQSDGSYLAMVTLLY